MLLLVLLLVAAQAAQAQTFPAKDPIFSSRLRHIAEMIPGSATDLPPYLVQSRDVYLLVTAGASYTEVDVLANPEVSPQAVARALASALAGTPLGGQPVEWSADRYSAAQVTVHSSRFGSLHGLNTVPIGPLVSGLRRAGFAPHLLLRVPRYAQSSLPSPHYGTTNFRWYDAHHLAGQSSVTVSARLSALALGGLIAYCLLVPIAGLMGLWLAPVLSRRLSGEAARLRFRRVSLSVSTGALVVQVGGMMLLLRTPYPAAFADLWFGTATTAPVIPFLVSSPVFFLLLSLAARRQEIRRFGPLPTPAAIPMSDEEKAARKRVAQWSALPHLVGPVALGILPFFVPRTSPLYPYIHPVALFLPLLGTLLAAKVLQKRLDKFTQKTPDDALTWRARQLGQPLGVRMPDVLVEDSSRATHLAFASHQGHHITLSRKLQETFTPAETDFVLAHHLACMKRRGGIDGSVLLGLLGPAPVLLLVSFALLAKYIPGLPALSSLFLSTWFFPSLIGYLLLTFVTVIPLSKAKVRQQIQRQTKADQEALEITGGLPAAESALDKLSADARRSPETQATMQTGFSAGRTGNSAAQLSAASMVMRRAALQKTAAALRFAPAPGTSPGHSSLSSSQMEDQAVEDQAVEDQAVEDQAVNDAPQ